MNALLFVLYYVMWYAYHLPETLFLLITLWALYAGCMRVIRWMDRT